MQLATEEAAALRERAQGAAEKGEALAIVHDQIEVQRASGALEMPAFTAALCNFDGGLSEVAAAAIYIECELAADAERQQNPGASGAVPLKTFVTICEAHGVTNVVKSG